MAQRFSIAELLRMRYAMAGTAPPASSVANSSSANRSHGIDTPGSGKHGNSNASIEMPLAVVDRLRFRNELLRQQRVPEPKVPPRSSGD
jgi:hypothetical protein